jgi:hypothetical protein
VGLLGARDARNEERPGEEQRGYDETAHRSTDSQGGRDNRFEDVKLQ